MGLGLGLGLAGATRRTAAPDRCSASWCVAASLSSRPMRFMGDSTTLSAFCGESVTEGASPSVADEDTAVGPESGPGFGSALPLLTHMTLTQTPEHRSDLGLIFAACSLRRRCALAAPPSHRRGTGPPPLALRWATPPGCLCGLPAAQPSSARRAQGRRLQGRPSAALRR